MDVPAGPHHPHDARLAHQPASAVARQHRIHQPRLKPVDLHAGIAQPGHLDNGRRADMQPRPLRQAQQIDAARGDVLAQVRRRHPKAALSQLIEQLCLHQVHLPQVRHCRVARHARAVLHRHPHMRIALHAQPLQQPDRQRRLLAEPVRPIPRHCQHHTHAVRPSSARSAFARAVPESMIMPWSECARIIRAPRVR